MLVGFLLKVYVFSTFTKDVPMKYISIVFISLFSFFAHAAPHCGAPLADRTFCASLYGETKRVAFRGDCTLNFTGKKPTGETASFNGSWNLDGNLLTVSLGTETGVRNIIFGSDMNSFSAEGYPDEVYSVCQ
jgi:hypothetical protein